MKSQRHQTIKSIIEGDSVSTQGQLRAALTEAGFTVNQATLSRDMRELGIVKREGRYVIPPLSGVPPFIAESVREIDRAVNTVVFKCTPGTANAACAAFDQLEIPGVVGTLAGDDTIFILMRTEKDAAAFVKLMKGLISGQNGDQASRGNRLS